MKKSVLIALFLILLIIPVAFAFSIGNKEVFSLNKAFSDFFAKLTGKATVICTDTDGGKVYNVKGYGTGIRVSGVGIRNAPDQCVMFQDGILSSLVVSCSGTGCRVREWWCDGNILATSFAVCSAGCSDGACLATPTCTENWVCEEWGSCHTITPDELTTIPGFFPGAQVQTRGCKDSNNCGTFINKPSTAQSCTTPTTQPTISLSGQISSYNTKDGIKIIAKAVENDGTSATSDEGYNIQFYTYDSTTSQRVEEIVNNGQYNGNYDSTTGYWYISFNAPSNPGAYYTEITLYCSRENTKCYNLYGSIEWKQIIRYNVVAPITPQGYEPVYKFYNPSISPDYIKDIVIADVWTNKDPQAYILGESGTLWVKAVDGNTGSPLLPENGGKVTFTMWSDISSNLLVPYTAIGFNRDFNYYVGTFTIPKGITKEQMSTLKMVVDVANGKMLSPGVINSVRYVGAFNPTASTPITTCTNIKEGGSAKFEDSNNPNICFDSPCVEYVTQKIEIININTLYNKVSFKILGTGEIYKDLGYRNNQASVMTDLSSNLLLTINNVEKIVTLNKQANCIGTIQTTTGECNKILSYKNTFKDSEGTNTGDYDYTETLEDVSNIIGGSLDISYKYTLNFVSSAVNVKDSADLENNVLTILGRDWTITDVETSNTNYGSIDKLSLLSGDVLSTILQESTVSGITVKDVDEAETKCVIEYGGKTYIIDKGQTKKMDDGTIIGVTDVTAAHESGAGQDMCELAIRARLLILDDYNSIIYVNNNPINADISISPSTGLGKIEIRPHFSNLKQSTFIDPLFGNFKINYEGKGLCFYKPIGYIEQICVLTEKDCPTICAECPIGYTGGGCAGGVDLRTCTCIKPKSCIPPQKCLGTEQTILQGSTVCGITVMDVDEAETKCIVEYAGKTYIIDQGQTKTMDDGTIIGVTDVTAVHESGAGQDMCTIKIGRGIIQPPIEKCDGCLVNEKCIPYGTRVKGSYCALSGNIVPQKQANQFCENSYECDTNLCISQKCVSQKLWDRFVKWFSGFFSR